MNLKAEKSKIEAAINRNKVDMLNKEQELDGLKNGSIYLQGQMALINHLLEVEAKEASEGDSNENIPPNIHKI